MESPSKLSEAFAPLIISFGILLKRYSAEDGELRIYSNLFSVLHSLCTSAGKKITMTALANELGIMKQQLTRLVNELEELGYAVREEIPENRRSVYVHVTENGRKRYNELIKMFADRLNHSVFSTLSDREIEEVVNNIKKLGSVFNLQSQITD